MYHDHTLSALGSHPLADSFDVSGKQHSGEADSEADNMEANIEFITFSSLA